MGDDSAMMKVVSSANVACGFHAGDPDIMAKTFVLARENGVAAGAHVGFDDLPGFGRRPLPLSTSEIENAVAYQLGAAMAMATLANHKITHVKAHGALANIAERDKGVADAIARAVRAVDPSLALLAIALTEQPRAGERAGLAVAHEIFADRAYSKVGTLVPRSQKGAVIDDADEAIARVLIMLHKGALTTTTGSSLTTPIDSVCVHGDTPNAVDMARRLRAALEDAGWTIRSFTQRG
jgi:UPF0271 protein